MPRRRTHGRSPGAPLRLRRRRAERHLDMAAHARGREGELGAAVELVGDAALDQGPPEAAALRLNDRGPLVFRPVEDEPRRMLLRMCSNLHQIYVQLELADETARVQRYIVALAK